MTDAARAAVAMAKRSAMLMPEPVVLAPTGVVRGAWVSPMQVDPFLVPIAEKVDLLLAAARGALAVLLNAGAGLGLWNATGSWNIYTQIGVVTLIGLISKHGIMIVEFANQLQEQGKSKLEAVLDSATLRLRPILMTTGAMVLGAVPLALASGAGAEARHQIGWVIVGGLSIGTVFTLLVVPVVYLLLARDHRPAAA